MNLKTSQRGQREAGFTLPELIVVIAIIAIVTTISILNYKSYTNTSALSNTAYDLGLTVRQTQLYGIAVKDAGNSQFQNAYGVHFSMSPTSYIVYSDADKSFDYTGPSERISTNSLPQGFSFSKICMLVGSNTPLCASIGDPAVPDAYIDIEFIRPNPDAIITTNLPIPPDNPETYKPDTNGGAYYGVCLYVTSGGTNTRNVYVDKTGQISVNSTNCTG